MASDFDNWFEDDFGSDYDQSNLGDSSIQDGTNWGSLNNNNSSGTDFSTNYDYNNEWNDYSGNTNTGLGNMFLSNPSYNYSGSGSVTPATADWGSAGGSIQSVLKDLFTKGTTSNTIGQLGTALLSGYQNKQKASALQNAVKTVDPFGSQRAFYQQQAQNAVTNPFSSPIVASQVAQLQAAQDRKDAAAGRRSNSILGDTAVMSQAAQIAQNYQNQMAQQGGSNISPSGAGSLLSSAAQANTDGYISPIAALFGNQTQANSNSDLLSALRKMYGA